MTTLTASNVTTAPPIRAAGAVVVRGTALLPEVLLVRRGAQSSVGALRGTWSLPGGRIEPGETAEQAAEREALEETSVRVQGLRVLCTVEAPADGGARYAIDEVLCTLADPHDAPLAGDDASEARFVPLAELASLGVTAEVQRVIALAVAWAFAPRSADARALVRPLEADWQSVLDDVARRKRYPTSGETAAVARIVRMVSDAYNERGGATAGTLPAEALGARLVFSFPRDVPKGAGAVRELVASGALRVPPDRPLRVLDLGAGLGATSRGLVRALAAATTDAQATTDGQPTPDARSTTPAPPTVDALLVDAESGALELARLLADARPEERGIRLRVSTARVDLAAERAPSFRKLLGDGAPFDVILLGQVLSELHGEETPDARAQRHAAWIVDLAKRELHPSGVLVVVEPALRVRSRHLHEVRAQCIEAGLYVLAPCVHEATCPMLARSTDWCHEDLSVDLPPWLVPVARAAGLRFEGLTFSYLVLAREPRRLSVDPSAVRVISSRKVTKGRSEVHVCGPREGGERLLFRLDRDAPGADRGRSGVQSAPRAQSTAPLAEDAWPHLQRGDVVTFAPPLAADGQRIARGVRVEGAPLGTCNAHISSAAGTAGR